MNKRRNLANQLILLIIAALLVATGIFFILNRVTHDALDRRLFSWTALQRQGQRIAVSLQDYVDERQLTLEEVAQIEPWAKKNSDVLITLYKENAPVYSSNLSLEVQMLEQADSEIAIALDSYEIDFSDGAVQMIPYMTYNRYYSAASIVSGSIAFFIFLGIVLYFLQKKLRVIAVMENELKILGGGDLHYPITLQGNDELTALAEEIDTMRTMLLEKQEAEQAAIAANRGLITAMSHDLRTPLTVLIGYLEILHLDKGFTEKQHRYLEAASAKAEQIKTLSDQLFEYFLVFQKDSDQLVFRTMDGAEYWAQFVEPCLFDLSGQGYLISADTEGFPGHVRVDVELMRRVFFNLTSNWLKYADPTREIRVTCKVMAKKVEIRCTNYIAAHPQMEGSGIGLKTCEKILQMHGGSFQWEKGARFESVLTLPLQE